MTLLFLLKTVSFLNKREVGSIPGKKKNGPFWKSLVFPGKIISSFSLDSSEEKENFLSRVGKLPVYSPMEPHMYFSGDRVLLP